MGIGQDKLKPFQTPLVGFTSDRLLPLGTICLPITTGTREYQTTWAIDFLVVDCPSTYNTILGRPGLNRFKAITSTYHLLMRFPTEKGIGEVRGDQVIARECYMASLNGEPSSSKENMSIEGLENRGKKTQMAAEGDLEDIILNTSIPDRTTRVGVDLPNEYRTRLGNFLVKNRDVFT